MAGNGNIMVHMVELLGIWPAEAKLGSSIHEEPVVIVTVRPQPDSFQSHNFGVSLAQAERLWEDLGSILGRSVTFLMLAILTLAATGCSARVEVERQNWNNTSSQATSGEKERTAVQLDVMQNQRQKAAVPQPSEVKSDPVGQGQVNISSGTVIVVVPGDGPSVQMKAADEPSQETEKRSGRTGIYTRIGWPSEYWRHGFLAFGGCAIVYVLVGWAAWILVACAFCTEKSDDPMLPIIVTLGLLIAAAVVLQILPSTESGFQFIPLLPWAYSGFLPIGLSILCWGGIFVAAETFLTHHADAPAVFSAAMLVSMVMNLLLSSYG